MKRRSDGRDAADGGTPAIHLGLLLVQATASLLLTGAVAGFGLPSILLVLLPLPLFWPILRPGVPLSRPSWLAMAGIAVASGLLALSWRPPGSTRPWLAAGLIVPLIVLLADGLYRFVDRARETESALRESERLRRSIVESSPDHIMLLDPEAVILFINRTVPDLTPEQVVGTPVYDYVPESDHPAMRQSFERVLTNGVQDRYDVSYLTEEGEERHFESYVAPVVEEGRVIAMAVNSRDVTERRAMEQERERLSAQLQQAHRLEALGRLAGGIAHDFNNLLTAILGNSELLLTRLTGSELESPLRQNVEQIHLAAERASLLTRQLLTFGRRQLSRPEVVDPGRVLHGLEPLLRRLIQEDVLLDFEVAPEVSTLRIDPSQLEQVILNLVLNARDAMPEGGTITLDCRDVVLTSRSDLIPPSTSGGRYVRFSVSDQGQGIEPEAAKHLFDPFFTTKPDSKGTGLGLATVYGVVAQAQGHIGIESRPREGATLSVYLPCDGTTPTELPTVAQPAGGREVILVCEDEEAVRRVTCQILESAGYTVYSAAEPEEALRVAGELKAIQLLVTDVVMPEMSGTELARQLRQQRPDLAVLLVSGYSSELLEARSDSAPELDLLLKPFLPNELLWSVRRALDVSAGSQS